MPWVACRPEGLPPCSRQRRAIFSALVPWMAEISTPGMERAARAWVSVMLPPPIRPMWVVMKSFQLSVFSFQQEKKNSWNCRFFQLIRCRTGESVISGDKVFVSGFSGFGRGDRRVDQDAVAESGAGIGS